MAPSARATRSSRRREWDSHADQVNLVSVADGDNMAWANMIMEVIWPYAGDAVNNLLCDQVVPMLQEKLPPPFKKICFKSCTLGKKSPKIGPIHVHAIRPEDPDTTSMKEALEIEVGLNYDGDLDLHIDTGAGATVGLKHFTIKMNLHIILGPLIDRIPVVAGLQLFLVDAPEIKWNFVGMLGVPGLETMLTGIVTDVLEHFLVLPNRLTVRLCNDERLCDLSQISTSQPIGVLKVRVKSAKNLPGANWQFGTSVESFQSDPYVKYALGAEGPLRGTVEHRNTCNPTWMPDLANTAYFLVFSMDQRLQITVHNEGSYWKSFVTYLGKVPPCRVQEIRDWPKNRRGAYEQMLALDVSEVNKEMLHVNDPINRGLQSTCTVEIEWFDMCTVAGAEQMSALVGAGIDPQLDPFTAKQAILFVNIHSGAGIPWKHLTEPGGLQWYIEITHAGTTERKATDWQSLFAQTKTSETDQTCVSQVGARVSKAGKIPPKELGAYRVDLRASGVPHEFFPVIDRYLERTGYVFKDGRRDPGGHAPAADPGSLLHAAAQQTNMNNNHQQSTMMHPGMSSSSSSEDPLSSVDSTHRQGNMMATSSPSVPFVTTAAPAPGIQSRNDAILREVADILALPKKKVEKYVHLSEQARLLQAEKENILKIRKGPIEWQESIPIFLPEKDIQTADVTLILRSNDTTIGSLSIPLSRIAEEDHLARDTYTIYNPPESEIGSFFGGLSNLFFGGCQAPSRSSQALQSDELLRRSVSPPKNNSTVKNEKINPSATTTTFLEGPGVQRWKSTSIDLSFRLRHLKRDSVPDVSVVQNFYCDSMLAPESPSAPRIDVVSVNEALRKNPRMDGSNNYANRMALQSRPANNMQFEDRSRSIVPPGSGGAVPDIEADGTRANAVAKPQYVRAGGQEHGHFLDHKGQRTHHSHYEDGHETSEEDRLTD